MIQARVFPNQLQVPSSPRPWRAAPPRGDSGCQGQESATPRPRPAGPKPHPPYAVPSRGPTALVGELTPQPRPRTRRWEPGIGHPGWDFPPASPTCRESPAAAGAAIFLRAGVGQTQVGGTEPRGDRAHARASVTARLSGKCAHRVPGYLGRDLLHAGSCSP